MKKIAFWFGCCVLLAQGIQAQGFLQGTDQGRNVVKFHFLGLVANNFGIAYERELADKFSLQLSLHFIGNRLVPAEGYNNMLAFTLDARLYLLSNGLETPAGAYLFPYLAWWNFNDGRAASLGAGANTEYFNGRVNMTGGGIGLGYQWAFQNGLTLDLWAGAGYMGEASRGSIANLPAGADLRKTYGHLDGRAGFMIGYCFGR